MCRGSRVWSITTSSVPSSSGSSGSSGWRGKSRRRSVRTRRRRGAPRGACKADLLTGHGRRISGAARRDGTYYARHDGEPQASPKRSRRTTGRGSPATMYPDWPALRRAGRQARHPRRPVRHRRAAERRQGPVWAAPCCARVIRILVERRYPPSAVRACRRGVGGSPRRQTRRSPMRGIHPRSPAGYLSDDGYTANGRGGTEPEPGTARSRAAAARRRTRVRRPAGGGKPRGGEQAGGRTSCGRRVGKGEVLRQRRRRALKEPAERALFDRARSRLAYARPRFEQGDFTGYLKTFAVLKSPVDAFFDSVMVMVEDPTCAATDWRCSTTCAGR